ncbi:Rho guanine nucleotide exchange factor 28 [Fasciola gigantica]|uniref:Rho guanine nucleotide exchange factor 28 n=1 Tax=Fasciola gigantica TaxID=46835 RepID=A0A504YTM8_FASGI|nr:Rho guanine nucleotide exchange factor 28 [Fasciola gigantica]
MSGSSRHQPIILPIFPVFQNPPLLSGEFIRENKFTDVDRASSHSDASESAVTVSNERVSTDDLVKQFQNSTYMNPNIPLRELLSRSDYLQKYPSWLGFCGPENKPKFSPTFIARNDTIWELIFSERGYVDMLLMVHDVYMAPFPQFRAGEYDMLPDRMSSSSLYDTLFPGLKELLAAHERLLRPLLALHEQAENHVVESLGPCLVKLFDDKTQSSLSQLYGGFLFAQNRIREELVVCKRCPAIAQFLEQCKHDPRSGRKSLEDCHMVIVQRWTKVETLLDAIIKNTLNRPAEVASLELARNSVRHLLKQAEAMMMRMEHAVKLAQFAELLQAPPVPLENQIETQLLHEMRSPETTLINYGPLRVTPIVAGQQTSNSNEVTGIALNNCFFMLRRMPETGRYQLFTGTDMPPVLRWGKVYGYFRKSVEKVGFGFFILLHSNAALTLFHCSTVDELARWEQIMNHGFAQWREASPITIEQLDSDLVKTRNAIAERWKHTEAILDLLRELDRDLEQAWSVRMFACSALIQERLKMQVLDQQIVTDPANSNGTNAASSQSDISRPRPSKTPVFPMSGLSPTTGSSCNQSESLAQITMELLHSNTYIDSLTPSEDLDQLLSLFRGNLARLSFALVGSSSACLSRSASDVEERKRPPAKPIRKNETFSVRDSISHANDPKTLAELGRKAKKRDAHRLSTTMASIFRSASRDKSNGSAIQQQTSFDLTLSPPSLGSQSKGLRSRPPPSNLGVVNSPVGCSSSSVSSRLSSQTSSTSTASMSMPPRPSLSFAPGQGAAVENTLCAGDSADGSGNGSYTSLLSQPSNETLVLLSTLNQVAERLFPLVCDLRTENVGLQADLEHVRADRDALEKKYDDVIKQDPRGAHNARAGCGNGDSTDVAVPTLTVKQETEKLRQDYESFTRELKEWKKRKQQEQDQIEREHTRLAAERTRLENQKAEYERRQRQYEENCKTLQEQINLHASRGVKFTGITMPGLQIPEAPLSSVSPPDTDQFRGSSTSLGDLDPTLRLATRPSPSPVHFHSTSDDLTSKWVQNPQFPRNPSSFSNLDSDNTPRSSLVPSTSLRNEDLPEHLRGSLVNQPSATRLTSDNGGPDSRLVNSWSANSPNASSTSSLMKLADSSKVRSTEKSKKSNRFRLH